VRILFDQGTPVPLRRVLTQHEVVTAHERGWSQLNNGDLLDLAEIEGFDVLVTTDTNLRHQQNLVSRRIAIVVLTTTSWPRIQRVLRAVVAAVGSATAGSYREVEVP
jgi:predicted nuclease of predicted toxin-antitoxin system